MTSIDDNGSVSGDNTATAEGVVARRGLIASSGQAAAAASARGAVSVRGGRASHHGAPYSEDKVQLAEDIKSETFQRLAVGDRRADTLVNSEAVGFTALDVQAAVRDARDAASSNPKGMPDREQALALASRLDAQLAGVSVDKELMLASFHANSSPLPAAGGGRASGGRASGGEAEGESLPPLSGPAGAIREEAAPRRRRRAGMFLAAAAAAAMVVALMAGRSCLTRGAVEASTAATFLGEVPVDGATGSAVSVGASASGTAIASTWPRSNATAADETSGPPPNTTVQNTSNNPNSASKAAIAPRGQQPTAKKPDPRHTPFIIHRRKKQP